VKLEKVGRFLPEVLLQQVVIIDLL